MESFLAFMLGPLRVWRLRLLWILILLLAAFVLFVGVIADVGGSAGPIQQPRNVPSPTIIVPASTPGSVE